MPALPLRLGEVRDVSALGHDAVANVFTNPLPLSCGGVEERRLREVTKAPAETEAAGSKSLVRLKPPLGQPSDGPSQPLDQAGCAAQARRALLTTSATSLGWEIMTTCEAPSISVTVAPMRS